MKAFKITVVLLLGLTGVFFLVAAFLPNSVQVERTITVAKPSKVIFAAVQDFATYKEWYPWVKVDPGAKNAYSTPSAGLGAWWEWEGEKVGKGKLTRVRLVENLEIEGRLEFEKPMKGISKELWFFDTVDGNATRIRWVYEGEASYPMGRYLGLFTDKMIGPIFEDGLQNLKTFLEK